MAEDAWTRAAGDPVLPDPRLAPAYRVLGTVTGQDAILRKGGPLEIGGARVFYARLLEDLTTPGRYVLVFRGTSGMIEWLIDAQFAPTVGHPNCGQVESGFWGLYQTMRFVPAGRNQELPLSAIVDFIHPAGYMLVTGHSLGAVEATYAAFDLAALMPRHVSAMLVASPHPGNAEFARAFAARVPKHVMFRNVADVVPDVPLWFGYCAVPNVRELSGLALGVRVTDSLAAHHHALVYATLIDKTVLDRFVPTPEDVPFLRCFIKPSFPGALPPLPPTQLHFRSNSMPTSNTSVPYLAANGATALAISLSSDKTAAANTAAAIGAFFSAGGTGSFSALASQFGTLISTIKDPAMAEFAANALAFVTPAAQIDWQVVQNTPFLGESLQGWFADTGAGISAAAGAELANQAKAKAAAAAAAEQTKT